MMRMSLEKAVPSEIAQMPCRYMKFKNIPYHLYPFSEQLNSKRQSHSYYVLCASANFYKKMQSIEWYVYLFVLKF